MSGENNNCAVYLPPLKIVRSIGGSEATWHTWNYQNRLETATKVSNFKAKLRDPKVNKEERWTWSKFHANSGNQACQICKACGGTRLLAVYEQ